MTSPPNFSASETASDDLPEAVGPRMATSISVDGCTGISGAIAEESAGIIEPIKSASSNESADRPKKAWRSQANPWLELRGASLSAHRQIVYKNEAQLDERTAEG